MVVSKRGLVSLKMRCSLIIVFDYTGQPHIIKVPEGICDCPKKIAVVSRVMIRYITFIHQAKSCHLCQFLNKS